MLKILAISDIHGSLPLLEQIIKRHKDNVDLIVYCGDLIEGNIDTERFLETFPKEKTILIPGNCDNIEVLSKSPMNIDRKIVEIDGYKFCGVGGSLITPWNSNYEWTEEEVEEVLKKFPEKCILVTHSPPKFLLDKTSTGLHVGSEKLLEFIEEKRPILVICGHIHEAKGVMKYKDTILVNPGCFGKEYAIIEIDKVENVDLIKVVHHYI